MNAPLATLLVDDDRAFSALAAAALQREGLPVRVAHSLHEARAALEQGSPDLVILDRRLPDGDGMGFLPELREKAPAAVIVMVTAHGDIASAVDAIRAGAADYVAKPVELADLVIKARRAAEDIRLRERLQRAEAELSGRRRLIAPLSAGMRQVVQTLDRIATSPRSPVLLLGETGVGKEVLAWHLHTRGAGAQAPFVHVNCAALPEPTVESELFGHERGAFTDARTSRRGLVEVASGGTLFLDEVGELSLPVQAKLLTFLDSGAFRRLGGSSALESSARIVAATNRDLEAEVRAGRFREDLWFRLGVFRLGIPPLRERPEDILPLAEGLLAEMRTRLGRRSATLGEAARARLRSYHFPGNVRELRNILERALVLEPGPELTLELLAGPTPAAPAGPSGEAFCLDGPPTTLEALERHYVRWVLARLGGRRMEAAKVLGLSYPTFLKRLEEP
ncbi:sigma-54-dependent Fis family transcriptional regulator [Aggregicoccus sp. 17bor-14]|uniref:sigma-54-dependent transcriptional regulator n=1 Tax=Myxococcaceae TaxID=31 RepID=UPI00129D129E|nr:MULTISPECIES: sigma-54 dependent transcriptional regulator [Myxococcaceae]MBF5041147.1 sigma-54-dependent Fis family transcriptional regulator [Simulacricoccus sp. 17bor-14]MRI86934.1 sigma-54-dependent Fis family transcriptional regulator [Aggregicoccus sp. 17bor-14]